METGPTGPSAMKASLRQSCGEQWSHGASQVRASTASGLKGTVLGRFLWNSLGETLGLQMATLCDFQDLWNLWQSHHNNYQVVSVDLCIGKAWTMLALLALNSVVVRDPAVEKTLNCTFALKSIELLA